MVGLTTIGLSWLLASRLVRAQDDTYADTAEPQPQEPPEPAPAAGADVSPANAFPGQAALDGGAVDGGTAADTSEVGPAITAAQAGQNSEVAVSPTAHALPSTEPVVEAGGSIPALRAPASAGRYGLGVDLGFSGPLPDVGFMLALRPSRWMNLRVGGGYNGFAFGVRGSATLINPFVVPVSLTGEGGHYFAGDANKVVRWFNDDAQEVVSLRRFNYDYLNLLGGLEFEGKHFAVYLRAGVTWMRTTIEDFAQSVHDASQVDLHASNPKVLYRGPTLKVGTQYFF